MTMEDDRRNAQTAEAEVQVEAGAMPQPPVKAQAAMTDVKMTDGEKVHRTGDQETTTEDTTTTTTTTDADIDVTTTRPGPARRTRRSRSPACRADPPT